MKPSFSKEQRDGFLARISVITFAILLIAFFYYFDCVWGFISKLFSIASPFFVGFGIAFLLGPAQRKIEHFCKVYLFRGTKHPRILRLLSTFLSVALLLLLVYLFLKIIVPQVIYSIQSIAAFISSYLSDNQDKLNEILLRYDFLKVNGDQVAVAWERVVSSQFSNLTKLLGNLMLITQTVVSFLYELLVSLITAVYLLLDKDHLCAQLKKTCYACMKRETTERLIFWTRRANRIFAGFISGKMLDSAIIGILCYIGMLVFRMEYPVLISSIITITNLIPFFGPFIGWLPCALILLIVNPMSALWFSLFVLVLQQLDGNVIGPLILGDSVGVSALSIMIAIVIGSGLFGFAGMLLSVPVYALGYAFVRATIHTRLKKSKLPVDTSAYVDAPEIFQQTEEEAHDETQSVDP